MNITEIKAALAGLVGKKVAITDRNGRVTDYVFIGFSSSQGSETARIHHPDGSFGDIYLSDIVQASEVPVPPDFPEERIEGVPG